MFDGATQCCYEHALCFFAQILWCVKIDEVLSRSAMERENIMQDKSIKIPGAIKVFVPLQVCFCSCLELFGNMRACCDVQTLRTLFIIAMAENAQCATDTSSARWWLRGCSPYRLSLALPLVMTCRV